LKQKCLSRRSRTLLFVQPQYGLTDEIHQIEGSIANLKEKLAQAQ